MAWPLLATLGAGALAGGMGMISANNNKPTNKPTSTQTKQQKANMGVLQNLWMSQLGEWVDTPYGKVFRYDPQKMPQYNLPRQAPLTGLQKAGSQMAWDASNFQNKAVSGSQGRNKAINAYRPGKLFSTLNKLDRPSMESTPYQFAPEALTGMPTQRQEIPQQVPKYLGTGAYNNQKATNFASLPEFQQQIEYQKWLKKQQEKAEKKKGSLGGLIGDVFTGDWSNALKQTNQLPIIGGAFAKGGPMPGPQNGPPINLVGEEGPELHIGQDGRQNMVGEQGPELLAPNQPGTVIPNNQLPPQMQQGQGPQDNTGQEMPLPGQGGQQQGGGQGGPQQVINAIANALMMPTMQLFGMGRASGGDSAWYYDDKGVGTELQPYNDYKSYKTWATGAGSDWLKSQDPKYNWASKSGYKTYQGGFPLWEENQRNDWSTGQYGFNPQTNTWSTAGTADQWVPGATWNANTQGYDTGNSQWKYNYATSQWELPAATSQYSEAPVGGWAWQKNNAGSGMWAPTSFAGSNEYNVWNNPDAYNYDASTGTYTLKPPVTDPTTPPTTTPTETVVSNVPAPTTIQALPQLNFDVNQGKLPQMTGTQSFAEQFPDQYAALMGIINNNTPAYNYDPNQITQQFEQSIKQPAMNTFWEQTAPQLQAYGINTGNLYGGQTGRNIDRSARAREQELNALLPTMQMEGKKLGAQAQTDLFNQKLAGLQSFGELAQLPSKIGLTGAQTSSILNDIKKDNQFAGVEMAKALADVDLAKASTEQVYRSLAKYNQNLSDKEILDNMVLLGYKDQMAGTAMRQELDNVGQMLTNAGLLQALGNSEQQAVQNVLTMNYQDWVSAMQAQGLDPTQAMNQLLAAAGMNTVENIVYNPTSDSSGMSALGTILALGQQYGKD